MLKTSHKQNINLVKNQNQFLIKLELRLNNKTNLNMFATLDQLRLIKIVLKSVNDSFS